MYTRRQVTDHVTKMNKDLYDNLQDGIDEAKSDIQEIKETVQGSNENKFSDQKTYVVGDLVTKEGILYKCKTPIEVPEQWNQEHWEEISLLDILSGFPFSFGIDEEGNYGYIKEGADTVTPFKSNKRIEIFSGDSRSNHSVDLTSYSGYENFTLDNFCIGECALKYNTSNLGDHYGIDILNEYDKETGILTLNRSCSYAYAPKSPTDYYSFYVEYKVYLLL